MREILFRGKRLQGENWVEGYFYKSDINKIERESGKATLIFTPDCDTFIYIPEAHNSVMVIPETVGQYTGLTDKNGKKIFEGDILSTPKWKGVVAWGDGYGGYCVQHGINRPAIDIVMNEFDVEVIGNIYDNPELMGGEANG